MTKDTKILVVGLGQTGLSVVDYFRDQQQQVVVVDSREKPKALEQFQAEYADVPVILGDFRDSDFVDASRIVLSPGVSIHAPVIKKAIDLGIPVISDIELFAREAEAPIIAITGSNGKTTVTSLVGEMAKRADRKVGVGGNIGTPALSLLKHKYDLYVLELSSFQLQSTFSLKSKTSVILNFSADHLDHHLNLQEYLQAKQSIYKHCEAPIINRDQKKCYEGLQLPATTISFGLSKPEAEQFGVNKDYLCFGDQQLISIQELPYQDQVYINNALAALALGFCAGLPMNTMIAALKAFKGLPHRCQFVLEKNNIRWINDSKATNVGAVRAALTGLTATVPGKIILIAGGLAKGADLSELRDEVQEHVRTVILMGRDAPLFSNALQGAAELIDAQSLQQAVSLAAKQAQPGDLVLLSPACASFDMFDNYQQRGELFMRYVKEQVS